MKLIAGVYLFGLLAFLPPTAIANPVASAQSATGNRYMSGGEVRLGEPVAADLYAAGAGKSALTLVSSPLIPVQFCKSEKGNPVMTPRTTMPIVWERR